MELCLRVGVDHGPVAGPQGEPAGRSGIPLMLNADLGEVAALDALRHHGVEAIGQMLQA